MPITNTEEDDAVIGLLSNVITGACVEDCPGATTLTGGSGRLVAPTFEGCNCVTMETIALMRPPSPFDELGAGPWTGTAEAEGRGGVAVGAGGCCALEEGTGAWEDGLAGSAVWVASPLP